MRETWYVLEDGSLADPVEVTVNEAGRLVHSSGVAVEMRNGVPRSRGVDDADAERAKSGDAKAKAAAEAQAKDMKPDEPKRGYKTRESKAD